ncbi:cryptochrome/photolyase family protein [Nocardia arizonensis]|uniref:cryptochrome/photolyase family protein n=1 Tax=Nocardia arizonensis TaxID=1141647 RepID=UPI0006D12B0E|nr:deoxyribodipyrimidine photo-lyase [Nocardia arizonensis]
MNVSVVLFTRDLRVRDNPALSAGCRAGATVPLFVLDDAILSGRSATPNRAAFLAAALAELDGELRAMGTRLVVRRGSVVAEVDRVAEQVGANTVHLAADVSAYSRRRESALRLRLGERGRELRVHESAVMTVAPDAVTPSTGRDHFAVFTPYFRRWQQVHRRAPLSRPTGPALPPIAAGELPLAADICAGEPSPKLSVGGERTGRELLREWLSGPIGQYAARGDDLPADATSHLSPYLHFGCLSAAEILHRTDTDDEGGLAYARQLAWRDFNHQLLAARPEAAWRDYHDRSITWRDDPNAARAWCEGRTGYPIIDAGMRQLRAEGWMPGRARLIAASFLAKTLRVDWRTGAEHFLHWLVDADIANNQLNWQWAAGTGTDTRPNRVLNPLRQAERFDPDGTYVRRWVPEVAHLEGVAAHRPWREKGGVAGYPAPIIDVAGM